MVRPTRSRPPQAVLGAWAGLAWRAIRARRAQRRDARPRPFAIEPSPGPLGRRLSPIDHADGGIAVTAGGTRLRFAASDGRVTAEDGAYSPAYGTRARCRVLRLATEATDVRTIIQILG